MKFNCICHKLYLPKLLKIMNFRIYASIYSRKPLQRELKTMMPRTRVRSYHQIESTFQYFLNKRFLWKQLYLNIIIKNMYLVNKLNVPFAFVLIKEKYWERKPTISLLKSSLEMVKTNIKKSKKRMKKMLSMLNKYINYFCS